MELKCEPIIAIIEPNMYQVDIPAPSPYPLSPAPYPLSTAPYALSPAPYPLSPAPCLLPLTSCAPVSYPLILSPQGKYDWAKCVRPTAARNYVKELLHSAVCVHAEVRTQSCSTV